MPITPNYDPENNMLTLASGTIFIDDEDDRDLLATLTGEELFVLDRIYYETDDFRYAVNIIEEGRYNFLHDVLNDYDLGLYYVDAITSDELTDSLLRNYFDYESYGRDLRIEGNFIETPRGLIEITD